MADFDLVLKRGILYDGTGAGPLRGDVGIRSGRIAALGAELTGTESLDCDGLCVSPGFIDPHAHSDLMALATEPALEMYVRQGVTLQLLGQDGLGGAPLRSGDVFSRREQLKGLLGNPDVEWTWRSVATYLDALDLARPLLDLAFLVPHGAVRESIIGLTDRPAAAHDVFRMKGLLARSLDEGAWGVSFGLRSPPGCFAQQEELVELAGVAASRHVPVVAQLRSESEGLLESTEELIRLGQESGAHIHIAHLKIAGEGHWPRLPQLLAALAAAPRAGVELTADIYPYAAGQLLFASLLPPWAHEGGAQATLARLANAEERARFREHLLDPSSLWAACGPGSFSIWSLPSGRADLVGKDLESAARAAAKDPLDFALDLLREEKLGLAVLCRNQSEAIVDRLLALPQVSVCAGSPPGGRPHPRAHGAFPRVLARFVRERRTLSLEQAVRKMTGLPADTFGLDDFGYLVEGKRANITVFEPEAVRDTATFEAPGRFAEGICHVLVGGKTVVRDGKITGERPGRVARRKRS
ncbi:MAG: D-aminoacylase [Deltaproteobacteria bacterium]|nr:D-aminoacylase [Deltaproteobacteria bacterium]